MPVVRSWHKVFSFGRLLVSLALLLVSTATALAWDRLGHRAIAALAEKQLSPAAAVEVSRLLKLDGNKALWQVATWADRVREDYPIRHTVLIPNSEERYSATRDCNKRKMCVVRALDRYIAVLADPRKTDHARVEALKFVVHLVGDIHQPVHASGTSGSELVKWRGEEIRMHQLWDSGLIRGSYDTFGAFIKKAKLKADKLSSCGTPEDWANDSHAVVRNFVYPALENSQKPIVITRDYATRAMPVIESRITLGASRLACVLNRALGAGNKG